MRSRNGKTLIQNVANFCSNFYNF